MSNRPTNQGFYILIFLALLISVFLISLFYIAIKGNKNGSYYTSSYNGHVDIEGLAQHLTDKDHERRKIVNFLSSMESTFHINPHILFQNSDYLVVTYSERKASGIKIRFYFTNNEPVVTEENDGEIIKRVRFKGFISYSYSYNPSYRTTRFESWYDSPPKERDEFSSGFGYNPYDFLNIWVKVVDLKKFRWYKP